MAASFDNRVLVLKVLLLVFLVVLLVVVVYDGHDCAD